MTTLVGACVISVLPWKCVTVRGKTSSPWPEPMPSGMPVGTEDVGGAELLPSPAAPAAGSAFGLGGGASAGGSGGYGIMPDQASASGSGDEVADAMNALPEDLKRRLGL